MLHPKQRGGIIPTPDTHEREIEGERELEHVHSSPLVNQGLHDKRSRQLLQTWHTIASQYISSC